MADTLPSALGRSASGPQDPAPAVARVGALDTFRVPSFGLIWLSGLIWHLSRWGVSFLGSVVVNDLTHSPRLVQLGGSLLYAPLLVGGVAGGLVSDRFDRLRTVRLQLAVIVPLTVAIGALAATGRLEVWMLYLYMFMVGIGWVTDMTSRRAMVFDIVGPQRMGNAMALESLSLSSGAVIGPLVGGTALKAIGTGPSYYVIAAMVGVAFLVLLPVQRPAPVTTNRPTTPARPIQDLREGVRVLRSNRGVMSILGVTAIANFFLFAYSPLVPVVAQRLGAEAFMVGLLAAASGMGMMTGSLVVARLQPVRRGLVYVAGVAGAMVVLLGFTLADTYWVAFALLVAVGVGGGLFGSTQSALVMAESPEHLRGRALGLLSMAIGALPVGMYVLGEVAQHVGIAEALAIHVGLGLALHLAWITRHPEVRRITTD